MFLILFRFLYLPQIITLSDECTHPSDKDRRYTGLTCFGNDQFSQIPFVRKKKDPGD